MLRLDNTKKLYPLWLAIIGALVFVLTSILVNLILGNEAVNVFVPAFAALIFGLILKLDMKKLIGLVLVFLVAYPLLFILMFVSAYGPGFIGLLVYLISHIVLALILALVLDGKKAILPYIIVFTVITALVIGYNYIEPLNKLLYDVVGIFGRTDGVNRVNEAVLPEFKGLGIALGLSMGLVGRAKAKENNDVIENG